MSKQFFLGGQAVIEGVMIRSPHSVSVAVRRASGEIVVRREPVRSLLSRFRALDRPLVRGIFALVEALTLGMRALNFSAEIAMADTPKKRGSKACKHATTDANQTTNGILNEGEPLLTAGAIALTMTIAFAVGVVLFVVVPNFFTDLIGPIQNRPVLQNMAEGLLRLAVFLVYLLVIGWMKDIRRVFQFHGAEHKVVWAFEQGRPLTVEAARRYSTAHPRCGTNFVFIVLVVSIIVFTFLGWDENLLVRVLTRIALLPVIAGISYEFIRLVTRYCQTWWGKLLLFPGLALQRLTTREPDDSQIEVAIKAMEATLNLEELPTVELRTIAAPEAAAAG